MAIRLHSAVHRLATGVGLAALAISAQAAHAQNDTSVPPSDSEKAKAAAAAKTADSGEIVVTAQRRTESVRKVPISIQVLTAETLERQGVTDTRDLATFTPTVTFNTSASAMISAFGLRGVGTSANAPGIQPSTALVIDGVPVYNQGEFVAGLGDIERVEILNGPQGTLFGKNSTAGVINIVTRQPTHQKEMNFEASFTNDREAYARATINLPLSENVRLRVNGFTQYVNPQIKNLGGPNVGGTKAYGAEAKLAVDFNDKVSFKLAGTYAKFNSTWNQYTIVGPSILAGQAAAEGVFIPTGVGGTRVNVNDPAQDVFATRNVKGTLEWDMSDAVKITSISNYTRFTDNNQLDGDGTPYGSNLGIGQTYPNSIYSFQSQDHGFTRKHALKYFSQEVRANVRVGNVDAVLGGFYQDVDFDYFQNDPSKFNGSFTTSVINSSFKNKTAAIFGDVNLTLTHWLRVFGGLRYTHETLSTKYHREDFFGPYANYNPVTGIFTGAPFRTVDVNGKRTINNVSGRAGIEIEPASNVNLYASFSKGYKGPAANNSTTVGAVGQPATLEPEFATAYELGAKLRLFHNRLSFNGAIFHEVIKNLQVTAIDPTASTVQTVLLNAGRVTSKGFEGDASFLVAPGLRVGAALAYVHAYYGGFALLCNSVQLATGTCPGFEGKPNVQSIDGAPAARSPKWKYTFSASYEGDLGSTGLKFYLQGTWTHTSQVMLQVDQNPLALEPGHNQLNASIGLKTADDRFEFQIFAKNLTDEFYYTSRVPVAVVGLPAAYLPRDYHRIIGIRIAGRF
jgi:iron complex outermembrane receptor protein